MIIDGFKKVLGRVFAIEESLHGNIKVSNQFEDAVEKFFTKKQLDGAAMV